MSRFAQALIIIILVSLAAQVVLAAVQPIVPYVLIALALVMIGMYTLRRFRSRR